MSKIAIARTAEPFPAVQIVIDGIVSFLFGFIDGFTKEDKRGWRKLWKRIRAMEPGETLELDVVFPRSGPYHRRHMKIEQSFFDAQECFENFEMFRDWLKIGAGHVKWVPGPRGAIVPIPKSISYSAMDDEEFKSYHQNLIAFLRTEPAGRALWKHLSEADRSDMVERILVGFNE